MIYFLLESQKLKTPIRLSLDELGVPYKFLSFKSGKYLKEIYSDEQEIKAIIVEALNPNMPIESWLDMLDSLARRIPVIVVADKPKQRYTGRSGRGQLVTWLEKPDVKDIFGVLDASGVIGLSQRVLNREAIPLYNPMLSMHMLRQHGSLSIMSVHSTEFRKIALEYGIDAYHRLQMCLQHLLFDLWGASGSFRNRDILCRTAPSSNTYLILLEQSRSEMGIPPPAALEKLADRLLASLHNLFWHELEKPVKKRLLPAYLKVIPEFSIGYGTALYNPCVDSSEVIESLIETSKEMAKVQQIRYSDRQRELVQTLIHTKNLLTPHYQGVFNLKAVSNDQVLKAQETGSLKPIIHSIYAFESLIRVDAQQVNEVLQSSGLNYLEARFLRPDVMFSMAQNTNLSLELDQACLKQATQYFGNLPGVLLVNILPRNFYYIDLLRHLIPEDLKITFEVSESEAINNFGLLLQAKEKLANKNNYGIAIDDFGKGYAGLDRILKIKPEIIKLDRSLVSDIDQDEPKKAFVSGLVSAASITKSVVLAEGVERIEELELLRSLGIDLVQGFLLHKPQARSVIAEDIGLASEEEDQPLDTVA